MNRILFFSTENKSFFTFYCILYIIQTCHIYIYIYVFWNDTNCLDFVHRSWEDIFETFIYSFVS